MAERFDLRGSRGNKVGSQDSERDSAAEVGTLLKEGTELLGRQWVQMQAVRRPVDQADVDLPGQSLLGLHSAFASGLSLSKQEQDHAARTHRLDDEFFLRCRGRRRAPF